MKFYISLLFLAAIIGKSFGDDNDCDTCTKKLKSSLDKYDKANKDKEIEIAGPVFCPKLKLKGFGNPQIFEKSCIEGNNETQKITYHNLVITTDCKIDGKQDVLEPQINDEVKKFPKYMEDNCKRGFENPVTGAGRTVVVRLNSRDKKFEKAQKDKPDNEKENKDDKDIHAVMTITKYPVYITIDKDGNLVSMCPEEIDTKDQTHETETKSAYAKKIAGGFKLAEMARYLSFFAFKYLYEDGSGDLAGSMKKLAMEASCFK